MLQFPVYPLFFDTYWNIQYAACQNSLQGVLYVIFKTSIERAFLELDLIQNDQHILFDLCIISKVKDFARKIDVL